MVAWWLARMMFDQGEMFSVHHENSAASPPKMKRLSAKLVGEEIECLRPGVLVGGFIIG